MPAVVLSSTMPAASPSAGVLARSLIGSGGSTVPAASLPAGVFARSLIGSGGSMVRA